MKGHPRSRWSRPHRAPKSRRPLLHRLDRHRILQRYSRFIPAESGGRFPPLMQSQVSGHAFRSLLPLTNIDLEVPSWPNKTKQETVGTYFYLQYLTEMAVLELPLLESTGEYFIVRMKSVILSIRRAVVFEHIIHHFGSNLLNCFDAGLCCLRAHLPVSRNDELCIKNEEFCIRKWNFVSKTRTFVLELMNFAGRCRPLCPVRLSHYCEFLSKWPFFQRKTAIKCGHFNRSLQ